MRPFVLSSVRVSCFSFLVAAGQLAVPALRAQGVPVLRVEPMLVAGADAPSADTVADTKTIMDRAKAEAAREHKDILVKFSASWCGPCHLWAAVLADPKVQPIVDARFVVVDLDPAENIGDPKHHVTPGALEYMASLGNKVVNLPFLAVLKPSGALVFSSIRPPQGSDKGGNFGYPDQPQELDWLMTKLHEAQPSMSSADLAVIRESLVAHAPKHAQH